MTSDNEKNLISNASGGSVSAFEELYRMHAARVYGLCVRLSADQADAQDAMQETFIKAWNALGRFRGDSALSTWLHRIAFNEAMRLRRQRTNERRHLQLVDSTPVTEATSETEIERLERAITKLPNRAREALVLHKIYGYTHEETADFMGTAVGTCKAQVHRALQLLREGMKAEDSHEAMDSARRKISWADNDE